MIIDSRNSQRGYTMIELMVAVTIGLMILAGLVSIFANNSRARAEIDRANQQNENGRYALELLTDDLHNAGYYAEFNPGTVLSPHGLPAIPTAVPDPCAADLASLRADLAVPVQGYDDPAAGAVPSCLSDVRPGTDILVIRRASTCAVGDTDCDPVVNGAPYFEVPMCGAEIQSNPAQPWLLDTDQAVLTNAFHQGDCTTAAPERQYLTRIYFIANNDKPGDGIPTLKRVELGAGGFSPVAVPLVEGIENLQIEYGLDTSAPTTGAPAVYTVDPSSYAGCAPVDCVNNWRNVVTAKVYLLARNTTPTPGYVDGKTYTLGLNADGSADSMGPFGDAYRRHAYESVVRLNNIALRNSP